MQSDGVQVTLNGEPRRVASGTSVAGLIATLSIEGRVAVAINREIVPRSHFDGHRIEQGDRIEILEAVGGG